MYSYVFGARKKLNVATTIRHRHPIVDVTKKKKEKKQDLGDLWNPIINSTTLKSIYTGRLRATEARLCQERPASRHRRVIVTRLRNIIIYYIRASHCDILHPQSGFMRVSSLDTKKIWLKTRDLSQIYIYIVYITRQKTIQTCLNS